MSRHKCLSFRSMGELQEWFRTRATRRFMEGQVGVCKNGMDAKGFPRCKYYTNPGETFCEVCVNPEIIQDTSWTKAKVRHLPTTRRKCTLKGGCSGVMEATVTQLRADLKADLVWSCVLCGSRVSFGPGKAIRDETKLCRLCSSVNEEMTVFEHVRMCKGCADKAQRQAANERLQDALEAYHMGGLGDV